MRCSCQILNKAWHDASERRRPDGFRHWRSRHRQVAVTHEFVGAIPHDDDREPGGRRAGDGSSQRLRGDPQDAAGAVRRGRHRSAGYRNRKGAAPREARRVSTSDFSIRSWQSWNCLFRTRAGPCISGQERSRRMQEAAVGLLLFLGRVKPVVLLVEDLHWIDRRERGGPGSAGAGGARLSPPAHPDLPAGIRSQCLRCLRAAAEIRLPAFNAAEAPALLDHLGWSRPELERLRSAVSNACKGNALFLEETSPRPCRDRQAGRAAGPLSGSGRGRQSSLFRRTSRRSSMPASNVSTRMPSGWPRSPRSSAARSRCCC